MSCAVGPRERSGQIVDILALGDGDRAKKVGCHPFAEVAEEIPIAGVFGEHIGLARILYRLAQAQAFFLGVSTGHLG